MLELYEVKSIAGLSLAFLERRHFMATATILGSVVDLVKQMGEKLSKILDTDVLIVDNNFNIISETNRYFVQHSKVIMDSMIGQVIVNQESLVVADKNEFFICQKCVDFNECQVTGFIGVPIFYVDRVIGAVALIFPRHRAKDLLQHSDVIISFIKYIILEDLVEKIPQKNELVELVQIINEREHMLDNLSDAVVLTDEFGVIKYYNKQFENMIGLEKKCINERIQKVIPHNIVLDYFESRHEYDNQKVLIEWGEQTFYGFVSCRAIQLDEKRRGVLFIFKTVVDVIQNARAVQKGSKVTLQWLKDWLFTDDILDKAKALAVTDDIILIKGKSANLNEILAKGICNFSNRNLQGLTIIKCDSIYKEHLEHYIFGEFGEIQKSDKGTIFISNIETMPLYLQKYLLDFIKYGQIRHENMKPIKSDVRFIFSTTVDLMEMVWKGLFLEELYYRITENVIEIPPLQHNKDVLYSMITAGFDFYKKKYEKHNVSLSKEAVDYLCSLDWQNDTSKINMLLEQIVARYDGTVGVDDITALNLLEDEKEVMMSIEEIEKQKIKKLLEEGYKKTEISNMLGISRATLYRKIEEYGL